MLRPVDVVVLAGLQGPQEGAEAILKLLVEEGVLR